MSSTRLPSGKLAECISEKDSYDYGYEVGRAAGRYMPHGLNELRAHEQRYRDGYKFGYEAGQELRKADQKKDQEDAW